jgi:glycosyltransferase involved in cell wall biosynthesis
MAQQEITKRIYIDVTQAQEWQGRAAGIIRVMDEISLRFAKDGRFNTTFIGWDQKNGYFYEVDFLEALKSREHNLSIGKDPSAPYSSSSIRKTLTKIPLAKRTFHLIRNTYLYLRSLPGVWRLTKKLELEKGSTLFMPHGGVWESKTYSKTILNLKNDRRISLVPIIYDMCPIVVPQFCSPGIRKVFKQHIRATLSSSDLILSISKNTSSDIKKWLRRMSTKAIPPTIEFRLGDDISLEKGIRPNQTIPKHFILYVSTIEARKNHTSLYYSYKLAIEKGLKLPTLVIVGKKGWLAEDIYKLFKSDPAIKNHIILLKDTSDQELSWLYENSMFTVYPSFYEGWGLPVAESLLHGTPVIASSKSSIPEIGGKLVDYFSPYSPEEIMAKIHKYYTDRTLLQKKKAETVENYKPTSWDESYEQVASAILGL